MHHLLAVLVVVGACGAPPPPPSHAVVPAPPAKPDPQPEKRTDPYAAKTWTDKLGDPREAERAITELEQLGDPKAIPAIGKAWIEQGHPTRMLAVIIALARPFTAAEAHAAFITEFEASGRPASWPAALPFLIAAVSDLDDENPRSVDNAIKAAEALGEARLGVEALIGVALAPLSKHSIVVHIAAIRSLGKFGSPEATAALVKLVDREEPTHPRMARDRDEGRAMEAKYTLHLATVGAAVNALAASPSPSAARALVLVMYRIPELSTQIRRALVATGPAAKAALVAALRDTDPDVKQLFATRKLDRYCGDRGIATRCQPVSAREFYAAVVLGDFYDPATVPDLLAVLDHPATPTYYLDDQPSPNTQHHAAFDALRKIGSPTAAPRVLALMTKGPATTRVLAVATYPFLAHDPAAARALELIVSDARADTLLRQQAAVSLSRISADEADAVLLHQYAQTLAKPDAPMIEAQIAEIEIAVRCKADLACYAASLTDKSSAPLAIDRALLEIGRRGAQATSALDAVLDATASDDRMIRGGVLLALPKIAPRPCPRCVAKLDAAIAAGEGKPTLGDLTLETQVLRNYFAWAGK